LANAVRIHGPQGPEVTPETQLDWLSRQAFAYRKDPTVDPQFHGGWNAKRFVDWLNDRASSAPAPSPAQSPPAASEKPLPALRAVPDSAPSAPSPAPPRAESVVPAPDAFRALAALKRPQKAPTSAPPGGGAGGTNGAPKAVRKASHGA
jgi:hypothetical protein